MKLALDTNIIIESYVVGVWDTLKKKTQIIVTDTVLAEVEYYLDAATRSRKPIDKPSDVIPYVNIMNPDPVDMVAITGLFNSVFLESIDPGERDLLALAYADKLPEECSICSADVPAIEAISLIDKKDMGISFEAVLRRAGLTKTLTFSLGAYAESDYIKALQRGAVAKIQGTHFRR